MNRLVVFLFLLIYFAEPLKVEASKSLAPHAIKAIIDQYASENNREILIQNFGTKSGKASEVVGKLLKHENFSIAIENQKGARIYPETKAFYFEFTSVLVFDSVENYFRSFENVRISYVAINLPYHLVYIPGAEMNFIAYIKHFMAHRFYFLVDETSDSIDLATPFFFSPGKCRKPQWRIVNRFFRSQMKWEEKKVFMSKHKNLHGCPMNLQFYENKYETEIFAIFANHLNFTPYITNQRVRKLKEFEFSLSRGITAAMSPYFFGRMEFMHFEQNQIFIPPGEIYGDFEKMLLPFDNLTWIGIVLTILGGVVVIVVIKWLTPKNQEIYFGRNNRSPLMNFVSIILNGSQADSLAETLPRMLLMLFIVWCLIFR
jgi:hypothetical protein